MFGVQAAALGGSPGFGGHARFGGAQSTGEQHFHASHGGCDVARLLAVLAAHNAQSAGGVQAGAEAKANTRQLGRIEPAARSRQIQT